MTTTPEFRSRGALPTDSSVVRLANRPLPHPQELFRECSSYCELASTTAQFPFVLETAVRTAVETRGAAVLVVPGTARCCTRSSWRGRSTSSPSPTPFHPRRWHAGRSGGRGPGAFDHDGCALVDVVTARHELSLPPTVTLEQIKGFTLYATRSVLSGRGDELIDLAKKNITRRRFS